jgi:hypothetical protein
MLRDVITSFWTQDLTQAELVIRDDASPDETSELMRRVVRHDDRVVYTRNSRNVGLAENERLTLNSARGEYIVMLGDDDILLGPHALQTYVDAFVEHPDVHFAYPNQIQVDSQLNFDIAYRHFAKGAKFEPGDPSFRHTWLKSVQMAGLGLRRSAALYEMYPRTTMLFPQLELVGRLLSLYASYAIPEFLVGVRSHADQLGFHANRGRRIVGPEKLGTVEILDIAARLNSQQGEGPNLGHTAKVVAHSLATMLPIEKVHGSNRIVASSVVSLMRKSVVARRDPLLLFSLLMTVATPTLLLDLLRGSAKSIVRRRQARHAEWFSRELCRQKASAAAAWRLVDA